MEARNFNMWSADGKDIYVYHWFPTEAETGSPSSSPRAIIQIAHGMAENAKRYERLAGALTAANFAVYANDHRGHGRTAGSPEELGFSGEDGFHYMTEDMNQLGQVIQERHSNTPIFLLGHSMGSFLTQKMMYSYPERYAGFLLSGTCGKQSMIGIGEKVARLLFKLQGARHRSMILNGLVFGRYEKIFKPSRTPFDWLSRDAEEVDKYMNDPDCGVVSSTGFFRDFFRLLLEIHRPEQMALIPLDKPVYLFSGEADPVGLQGKGVLSLAKMYEELGIQDVSYKLYPGGRHEILNELNREEVTLDVIHWLDQQLPSSSFSSL
ncbi:alpha-beta hydrolase superfamily lysophospholipase [Paenibacillus shirakamiensis]|uniref:Alpha-beta hydrolase superfamily lysophospholipase n=1 Tax=Paenibacillus shirakamiensis TaxID=1265935 RepID=A0ABS4JFK4_9BACL|nr:alpha/beta hydrolase [Paenibacillus shirakamiensis]MBP2000505.1 alpha-beta hydrolase superfamily lysophospholipase [Paenibacillus shirakamiensis]